MLLVVVDLVAAFIVTVLPPFFFEVTHAGNAICPHLSGRGKTGTCEDELLALLAGMAVQGLDRDGPRSCQKSSVCRRCHVILQALALHQH